MLRTQKIFIVLSSWLDGSHFTLLVTVVTTDKQAGAELCQAHKGYIGDTEKDNYDRFNDHIAL